MKGLSVLSFGAGQDSTAILYRIALDPEFRSSLIGENRFIVVFSDTGCEHPETYTHLDFIKEFCRDHQIEFFHLTPGDEFHSPAWTSLEDQFSRNNSIAMKKMKSCTDQLKIRPIYRFLDSFVHSWMKYDLKNSDYGKKSLVKFSQENGKIQMIIGIAKGEEKRVEKAKMFDDKAPGWMKSSIEKMYPLITHLGLDRQGCQEYMRSTGLPVPAPSNCMMCPYISLQELLLLSRKNPEVMKRWIAYEEAKLQKDAEKTGERLNGVFGTKKTLVQKIQEAEEKFGSMSMKELEDYRFSHGHCISNPY